MSKFIGDVSAYAYAVSKGYTGTEEEFAELMAAYADVGQTAVDAKDAAIAAKTAAETAATTATTKAGEASQSASQAQASATTASTKASEASQSASTASIKATEATTAAGTATTAKNDAVSAQNAAETAQGKAEDAQEAAEDAAESVSASAAQIATNTADIAELQEDLETLDTEGTVPTSEQMLSDNYSMDSVPYHFRKTASDNADREELEIVGGSVAWNQFAHDFIARTETLGITITVDNTKGSITASGTATTTNNLYFMATLRCIQDHKYLFKGSKGKGWLGVSSTSAKDTGNGAIFNATAAIAGDNQFIYGFTAGDVINETLYPQIFDLTAMFGSTIADHIYALEQATAGAGVALFKSLFPKDYYPYDAGSMQSVSGLSEHRTVGFNAWDEEWEVGAYALSDGQKSVDNSRIRNKNFIHVFPSSSYCNGCPQIITALFYDSDKNYIGQYGYNSGQVFVTPARAQYMNFYVAQSYGNVYKNDICINISDPAKNGTYEPYDGHSYALDDSLTLRGIPTLVDGKIKWDGDVYSPSGKVTRRYGIVDLGTLTWTTALTEGDKHRFAAPINAKQSDTTNGAKSICSGMILLANAGTWSGNNDGYTINAGLIYAYLDAYKTDTDANFKAAMSGVYLVCELATPTTEEAEPYQTPQTCHYDGTEEFVSTGIVPVGHNTKYPDNMRMKLDNLPWNFASLIAPTESAYKATRNYTTGALLIVNNVLYKATANIANGGNITVGTNVTATTLAEVIAALS